jgi:phosphoribosyl 1,2-cyclic phosphodiesterase
MRGKERLIIHPRDAEFTIGDLVIRLVPTCHDASDPVAVHLADTRTGLTAGVATDIGRATAPIRDAFRCCHFLVLESNHDEVDLREAPYPWSLKQRIGGSQGHLSNRLAGELAAELAHPDLGCVLLAHLSEACNDSVTARTEVERALARVNFRGRVAVAHQDKPSPWYDVGRLTAAARSDGPQILLFEAAT